MGAGASIPDTESAITKEQWREIAGGDAAVADGVFDARAGADGTMPHPLSTQATAARLAPALRVDEAVIAEAFWMLGLALLFVVLRLP